MASNRAVRTIPAGRRTPGEAAPKPGAVAACTTACPDCNLRELCLPCCGLSRAELDVAGRVVFSRLRLRRGEVLYRTGDRFTALYAVRNGFFKSTALIENGRDQVTGFFLKGEVIGMDGIATERHTCDTVALEESEICAIPFAVLQDLAHAIPALQHHFFKLMSRAIVREHGVMLLLGSMHAEERLAVFLLTLAQRFAASGVSPSEFNLRMTREETGSYLGMKLETVSRTLSRFQEEGLIEVRQKHVRILDVAGLKRVIGRGPD